MTDMRATAQLLEYAVMRVEFLDASAGDLTPDQFREETAKIHQAITELRRRGDTIVRADDLRVVTSKGDPYDPLALAATARIETALGGRLT